MEARDARQLATKFQEITEHLRAEIMRAQDRQYDQADKDCQAAPRFKVYAYDHVWFNPKHLAMQPPSKKLDYHMHTRLNF